MSADLVNVVSFLTGLYSEGKAFRTINIARSMLSSTLNKLDGVTIGSHPTVKMLMRGIFNKNPPRPRYSETWNLDIVLEFFKSAGDNEDLDLMALSQKLAMLLALSLLLRVAELISIDLKAMVWSSNEVSFSLRVPRKTQHHGSVCKFNLKKLNNDKRLCPVLCLQRYLQVTKHLRNNDTKETLFICTKKPFGKPSNATMSRWLKSVLFFAGIDVSIFSAHSTRSAAASMAEAKGVSVDVIMKAAGWSSKSVFSEFYHRKIVGLEVSQSLFN